LVAKKAVPYLSGIERGWWWNGWLGAGTRGVQVPWSRGEVVKGGGGGRLQVEKKWEREPRGQRGKKGGKKDVYVEKRKHKGKKKKPIQDCWGRGTPGTREKIKGLGGKRKPVSNHHREDSFTLCTLDGGTKIGGEPSGYQRERGKC